MIPLQILEEVIDGSRIAARIEMLRETGDQEDRQVLASPPWRAAKPCRSRLRCAPDSPALQCAKRELGEAGGGTRPALPARRADAVAVEVTVDLLPGGGEQSHQRWGEVRAW